MEDAKMAILHEWLAKPASERTQTDALTFAVNAIERYPFKCRGDPYQHIMGWIRPHIA